MGSIKLIDIDKKFERKGSCVVNNLNLEVAQGEFVALIGDSGSGKTTILRMLSGLTNPTSGEIVIGGKKVFGQKINISPEDRKVGLVFQDSALFPHYTVEENILFGVEKLSKDKKKTLLKEMLKLTDLQGLEKRYPHQISGGQKQRVALARALAVKPELLLLDEPFNGLDFSLKDQIMSQIKEIVKKTGITTILVTHNRNEAFFMADKIAVLKDGKIHQYSDPFTIYNYPEDRYTAKFFGKANFIEGQVSGENIITPIGDFKAVNKESISPLIVLKPEDFTVDYSKGEIKAEIIQNNFYGHYTELKLKVEKLESPLIVNVDNHITLSEGDSIYLSPIREYAKIM